MKRFIFAFILVLIFSFPVHAQDIPAGVKMGMTYSQIRPLMTNGEWRPSNSEGIFYVFFRRSEPAAMYTFGIDSKKGLVSLEIDIVGSSVTDIVNTLSSKYGTPVSSTDTYIWGVKKEIPNDLFAISVSRKKSAEAYVEVRYLFLNGVH